MTEEILQEGFEGAESADAGAPALSIEERAKLMGWMPKEEFPGDPSRWLDAETFVKRAEEQLPILKSTLGRLERRLAEQNARMVQMQADFQHFMDLAKKAQERAYERALAELKERQRQAVDERDLEAFEEANRQYEEMLKKHPAVAGPDPVEAEAAIRARLAAIEAEKRAAFEEWVAENPWYGQDVEMTNFAWEVNNMLARTYPDMPVREALKEITRQVMQRFKGKGGGARSRPVSGVEEPGGAVTATARKGKTYADLPPEAKEVCDRFVRSGIMTRDQYVKTFFEAES